MCKISKISDERLLCLREAADAARRLHYAPYSRNPHVPGESGILVLAAAELLGADEGARPTVGGGSNIEVGNLTLTKHAEEVAILSAFGLDGEPPRRGRLSALYVAGERPCGSCREFAAEFASEDAVWVIERIGQRELREGARLAQLPSEDVIVKPFSELLPLPFAPLEA